MYGRAWFITVGPDSLCSPAVDDGDTQLIRQPVRRFVDHGNCPFVRHNRRHAVIVACCPASYDDIHQAGKVGSARGKQQSAHGRGLTAASAEAPAVLRSRSRSRSPSWQDIMETTLHTQESRESGRGVDFDETQIHNILHKIVYKIFIPSSTVWSPTRRRNRVVQEVNFHILWNTFVGNVESSMPQSISIVSTDRGK